MILVKKRDPERGSPGLTSGISDSGQGSERRHRVVEYPANITRACPRRDQPATTVYLQHLSIALWGSSGVRNFFGAAGRLSPGRRQSEDRKFDSRTGETLASPLQADFSSRCYIRGIFPTRGKAAAAFPLAFKAPERMMSQVCDSPLPRDFARSPWMNHVQRGGFENGSQLYQNS